VNPETYVVVPVYNEASIVRSIVRSLMQHFVHVICVDDGSTDGSYELLAESGATVLRHPVNLGQGAAIQTGIDWALRDPRARFFVTFDADGQHQVEDVMPMLSILECQGADVVLGSRFLQGGSGPTGVRRLTLRLATRYTNVLSGLRLTDTHNGLRAFNRRFAQSLDLQRSDMGHASEIIGHAAAGPFSIREAPTTVLYTEYSRSKGQSLTNAVNIVFDAVLGRLERGRRS
jgi:glycosyltransferase involved in cell wall biosynthesis